MILNSEIEKISKLILRENLVERVGLELGCEDRVPIKKEKEKHFR